MLMTTNTDTDRDNTLIAMYQEGHFTLQELGSLFNLSRQRVHQVLKNNNIPRKPRVLEETKKKAIELFLSGMSIESVARELDLGVETTRMMIRRAEVSRKDGSFLSKYPADIREGIYVQYKAGRSTLEIARNLGMPQSTVYSLLRKAGLIKTE